MKTNAWRLHQPEHTGSAYFTWDLERPAKPALPNSYFWTWDHSTNWVLDDPGLQEYGCRNPYQKQPATYLEDYRRLTEHAAGIGVKGIVIWGFLRDSHGGVDYSKRVAGYASERGIAIMPGFGTTWYGGAYYEGEHPYSLATFLRQHPDARMLDEKGQPRGYSGENGACPAHPAYRNWLRESLQWLYREFAIGGINLENGDLLTDHHPLTQAARRDWPADDPEPFFFQGLSYKQALEAMAETLPATLGTYATYCGFDFGCGQPVVSQNVNLGRQPPAMLKVLPPQSLCQWTLSGMILQKPLPLAAYLTDGAPAAVFDNPTWPLTLRPPCQRSVGFVHQGSQWSHLHRYQVVVSSIKEACLRAHRSGLEGVSIHGEVSLRCIPYALNYLAFSHFIHWPEDTLLDFGRKTLGQVLGGPAEGEAFAELLAHWDAGTLTDDQRTHANPARFGYDPHAVGNEAQDLVRYQQWRFWNWLQRAVTATAASTASFDAVGQAIGA